MQYSTALHRRYYTMLWLPEIIQNGFGFTFWRICWWPSTTGLVLELPSHKNECATKYLTLKGFYILVEKRTVTSHEPQDHNEMGPTQEVQYVPLLTSPCDRFKGYNTRVAEKRPTLQQSGHRSTVGKVGKRGGRMKAKKSIAESTSPVWQFCSGLVDLFLQSPSTEYHSFKFSFFLGRRRVVNNMEVGPCHRVVSVNKKLHFTSSPSTDMQQRRHTTRGNPEINPFLGEGEAAY